MNFFSKTLGVLAVAATAILPMAQTANAAPIRLAQAVPAGENALVQNVRHRRYHRGGGRRYYGRRNNGAAIAGALIGGALIGGALAAPRYRDPYYAPRRVYQAPRRVYRAAPRRTYGLSNAHIRYCYNRYRSYRVSDNTFQPYHGPRRQCR